jgi:lantibiotic biosynthesis protein
MLRAAEKTDVLAENYVHMHMNRLFRADQRAHELVIYDFLTCLYEGRVSRGIALMRESHA